MGKARPQFKCKSLTVTLDHNPYVVNFYNSKNDISDVIIFPIFHYEGERQYYDLFSQLIKRGERLITINLLTKKDRVLFFNYYFSIFEKIVLSLYESKFIKLKDRLNLLGFGVGAYLCSYLSKSKEIDIAKMILISPFDTYRDEYRISNEIMNFTVPTYIHFGQYDEITSLDNRFRMFENGHNNPNVHFESYPVCGHYLYYKDILSLRVEHLYRKSNYDCYIGDSSKYRTSALPTEAILNERFFNHLYNELDGVENKKRICLLTDVFPLFVNGVAVVIDLLQKELENLGFEVYIAALWNKKTPLREIPNDTYIPIEASYASLLRGHKELSMLKTLNFQKPAKQLALFGFDYLHLHTEYSMSQIALKLSKYTGVKLLYTYHTLWNLYYERKFGKFFGDITYKTAKGLLFNQVYKECEIITVPSKKSYEILKMDTENKDIRIIPSSVDQSKFIITKQDRELIENLIDYYHLKNKKVLGYIGRVSLEKNILETLEYVSRIKVEIPNIVFMIVGFGDAITPLKKAVKKLKVEDSVIFVGEIENSKLKYYYSLFDIFVTASNFETQGLTYFESALCGTPILAKDDKAIEDIFIDGKNAYIYKNFDEWTERVEKALFSKNKDIVNNAKKTVAAYSSDKWAKQLLGIYQELNPSKKEKRK